MSSASRLPILFSANPFACAIASMKVIAIVLPSRLLALCLPHSHIRPFSHSVTLKSRKSPNGIESATVADFPAWRSRREVHHHAIDGGNLVIRASVPPQKQFASRVAQRV